MAAGPDAPRARPSASSRPFGHMADGRAVHEYTLDNGRGLALRALNLGGIVTAIEMPDRDGRRGNVVLGFASLADYLARRNVNSIVGRCANRIAGAAFELDGERHRLTANDPPNALHGGPGDFGSRWWEVEAEAPAADGSVALCLAYTSADGEEGYPGRLDVEVRYTLTASGEWIVDYRARCDRPTIVNLTHHAYWNLAGGGSALDHRLTLNAGRVAHVDADLVPDRIVDVTDTPFDFRTSTPIGARIRSSHEQLQRARGYDHHWVIDRPEAPADALTFAARLEDDASGRVLEIETSEPGIQFYSGNFLDGRWLGAGGALYRQGDGVCLETQHPPNAVNRADFPSVRLAPGDTYASRTLHRLSTTSATPRSAPRADAQPSKSHSTETRP